MKNWKTSLGGAISVTGLTLLGVGIIPQLSGAKSDILVYIALAGFILKAVGTGLTAFFAQDAPPADKKDGTPPAALLSLPLLPFLFFGCASLPPVTDAQIQNDIALAAKIGAREGCKQDKNVEPYLQAAVVVLTTALADGNVDSANVNALLSSISIKEAQGANVAQYVTDALDLYTSNASTIVSTDINKVAHLRSALTGLRDGIAAGLAQFDATKAQ